MNKYLSLLFSALFVLCSYSSATAQNATNANGLDAQKEQVFATSIGSLLALEEQPPTDGTTVVPITADLEANILNLLAVHEDYFELFTPRVALYITDAPTQAADGTLHHVYSVHPGQEKTVLGYLACFDKATTEKVASTVASADGASSSTYYNSVAETSKSLLINLELDDLSQQTIDALYADYYDTENQGARDQANYVWIDKRAFTGDQLKDSTLPQNADTLGLYVSLDNRDSDTGYTYGDLYGRSDAQGNYNTTLAPAAPASTAPVEKAAAPADQASTTNVYKASAANESWNQYSDQKNNLEKVGTIVAIISDFYVSPLLELAYLGVTAAKDHFQPLFGQIPFM